MKENTSDSKSKNKVILIRQIVIYITLSAAVFLIFATGTHHLDLSKKYYSLLGVESQLEDLYTKHNVLMNRLEYMILTENYDTDKIISEVYITRSYQNAVDIRTLPQLSPEILKMQEASELRLNIIKSFIEQKTDYRSDLYKKQLIKEINEDDLDNKLLDLLSYTHSEQQKLFNKQENSKTWLFGAIISALIGVITALIRLYYTNKKLTQSKHLLERQKNNLDVAALVSETDTKGIITYVNEQFCQVSKFSKDELIGHPHSLVNSSYHPPEFWKDFWQTIKTGGIWRGEVCNKAKDGSLYWVQTTIIPMRDLSNNIVGYSSIRVDITDKKSTESQLQHSQKLSLIGELAANIGHEINNPLMIINGNIKKILKSYEEGLPLEQVKEFFDISLESIKRITRIADGLRTFTRIDSYAEEYVDIHKEINSTTQLFKSTLPSEVELATSYKADKFIIKGNSGRIQQVIMNLLVNARDAIKTSAEKKISVKTENTADHILVQIADSGIGIPENLKNKIFDSYFTTKTTGEGTGLGLGISLNIVKQLGGKISFESEAGKGTVFTISIPWVTSAETPRQTSVDNIAETKLSGHALIVDDEKGIRRILAEELETIGLTTEQADSGAAALQLIADKKFDFIFSDMQMPKMTGFEFIQQALKLPNGLTNYYVISGGQTIQLNPDQKSWLDSIVCGYISKPFGTEEIIKALSKGNCDD